MRLAGLELPYTTVALQLRQSGDVRGANKPSPIEEDIPSSLAPFGAYIDDFSPCVSGYHEYAGISAELIKVGSGD